jgi:hypothetical protein
VNITIVDTGLPLQKTDDPVHIPCWPWEIEVIVEVVADAEGNQIQVAVLLFTTDGHLSRNAGNAVDIAYLDSNARLAIPTWQRHFEREPYVAAARTPVEGTLEHIRVDTHSVLPDVYGLKANGIGGDRRDHEGAVVDGRETRCRGDHVESRRLGQGRDFEFLSREDAAHCVITP